MLWYDFYGTKEEKAMKEIICPQMNRFNYLTQEIDLAYHEASFKLGISDSAMMILYTLVSYGGSCTIGDIVTVGVSKQTINSALRKLENEGDIILEKIDGKKKRVRLTDKGQELAEKTALKIIRIENEIFSRWKQEDLDNYIRLTALYCKMIQEKIKEI